MWTKSTKRSVFLAVLIVGVMAHVHIWAQEFELTLSREERILGLTKVYTEAKYNFAFWDQIPDLDWDRAYTEFVPLVEAAENDYEYFRVLQKFTALLRDGHTYINMFDRLNDLIDRPPLLIRSIENEPVVVDFAETEETKSQNLVRFSVISKVNGMPAEDYLKSEIMPYVFAGTEHYLRARACAVMLEGKKGTMVELGLVGADGD
jgi:hypothetical protein